MIKAQELRTGNWVRLKVEGRVDEYAKVIEILEQSVVTTIAGVPQRNPYSNLHGISLTPEVLEKIGFKYGKYQTTDSAVYFKTYNDGEVKLVVEPEDDSYYRTDIGQPIQYIHQLQNLYFALTGEELNIQL